MPQGTIGVAYRYYFPLRRNNGTPRTGDAGGLTVSIVNPADDASITPTVTESTEVPGEYFVDIPAVFTTLHGIGQYGLTVEVTSNPRDFVGDVIDFAAPDAADAVVIMAVAYNTTSLSLEVSAYLRRDGVRVIDPTAASIGLLDPDGSAVPNAGGSGVSADVRGVFHYTFFPVALPADLVYDVDVSITDAIGTVVETYMIPVHS